MPSGVPFRSFMVGSNEAMMPSHTTTRTSSSRATSAQCWSAQPLESSCRPTEESLGACGAEECRGISTSCKKHCKKKWWARQRLWFPLFGFVSIFLIVIYCLCPLFWPFQLTRYLKPFSKHDILESVELFSGLHRSLPTFCNHRDHRESNGLLGLAS